MFDKLFMKFLQGVVKLLLGLSLTKFDSSRQNP